MSNATARVTEYLRQFRRLRDTGGVIHNVHTDPEAEAATLTAADLVAVLGLAEAPALRAEDPAREELYEAAVRAVLDLCDAAGTAPPETDRPEDWLLDPADIREAIAAALKGSAGEAARAARDRAAVRGILDLCSRIDDGGPVGMGTLRTGAIYRVLADLAPAEDLTPESPVSISGPGAGSARIRPEDLGIASEAPPWAPELEHRPCCSTHGISMDCEQYRRTHFVEVRPCCSADRARLEAGE